MSRSRLPGDGTWDTPPAGPLAGLRVVELAGIGPVPHTCMVLGDLGADVVRIERPVPGLDVVGGGVDHLLRNRRSFAADLKQDHDLETVRRLVDVADVLVEGFWVFRSVAVIGRRLPLNRTNSAAYVIRNHCQLPSLSVLVRAD
ncbi:CoA transferase [Nocardioides potassii]|uniref:CoA transferase n=1 Tax=Nocardioides potassii TaxID=2911371 RepID=UPI0026E5781E|nr:CoA transferase [Nocardioides potassii]